MMDLANDFDLSRIQREILEELLFENTLPGGRLRRLEGLYQFTRGIAGYFNNLLVDPKGGKSGSLPEPEGINSAADGGEPAPGFSDKVPRFIRMVDSFVQNRSVEHGAISLNEIVKRQDLLHRKPFQDFIEYRTELSSTETVLFSYPGFMEQALDNIIANSIEAMPEGGCLTVSTGSLKFKTEFMKTYGIGERLACGIISVSDTGTGVHEGIAKKVFEPFFTTKEKRIGLGLSIAHEIVRLHNGCLQLQSHGEGTTANIYLPVYESFSGMDRI
jgi:signal transduction histidine kinase